MKTIFAFLTLSVCLAALGFAADTTVSAGTNGQATPASTSITWMLRTVAATVTCPQSFLEQGDTMTCTATLNQNAPANKTITPTTSDATKITVSAPFSIAQGSNSGTFTVTAQ